MAERGGRVIQFPYRHRIGPVSDVTSLAQKGLQGKLCSPSLLLLGGPAGSCRRREADQSKILARLHGQVHGPQRARLRAHRRR